MTTMTLTLKEKVQSLVGAVACNGSMAAWAVEEIIELFLKEKTVVANECIAALDDINNYDRILALLGMQEEGDPVAWVEAHLARGAQVPEALPIPCCDPPMMDEGDWRRDGYVEGWNACRQALLAQRGQVGGCGGVKVPDGFEVDADDIAIAVRCKDGRKALLRSDRLLTYNDRVLFDFLKAMLAAAPTEAEDV